MISRTAQKLLVKNFNAYAKASNKSESKQMNDLFDQINKVNPDLGVAELLDRFKDEFDKTGTRKILEFATPVFVDSLKIKQAEEVEEVEEVKKEVQPAKQVEVKIPDEKLGALGVFEKAICETVVSAVSPLLLDEAKPVIDEFIQKTYGNVIKTVSYDFPKHGKKMEGIFHEKFEEVLAFVEADEPVLLTGPAGTGKNVICKQVAEAMNLEFYFSNAVTQEYKITGFTDANGNYQPSQFYKAFTQGGVFMLDEMDASIPEVLIILNAAIANRYFDFPAPIGKVEAHPDFRIVAAANTFGTGADVTYTGRYQLDGASLDRFAVTEIGYSSVIEESITDDKVLLEFFRSFRKAVKKTGNMLTVSYRALKRMDKMQHVLSKQQVLKTCLLKNLEKDDLNIIIPELKQMNSWTSALKEMI